MHKIKEMSRFKSPNKHMFIDDRFKELNCETITEKLNYKQINEVSERLYQY